MRRFSFWSCIIFLFIFFAVTFVSAVEHKTKSSGKSERAVVLHPGTLQQGLTNFGGFWQPNPYFLFPKGSGLNVISKSSSTTTLSSQQVNSNTQDDFYPQSISTASQLRI